MTLFSSRRAAKLTSAISLLVLLSLACALPGLPGANPVTPTSETTELILATPTQPPPPLPPALVESDPPPGSEVGLNSPITLYFNQAMNRTSVEGAITAGGIAGRFDWQDDSIVRFSPDSPLTPDSALDLRISVTAQSKMGMPFSAPVDLSFRAAGSLRLAQALPEDGQAEVDPTAAIVAAFNYPVVALGADPTSLPPAFSLEPAANGRGEWVNTSTFIFYPEPALAGGTDYSVQVNPALTSTAGAPLQELTAAWSFRTSIPQVVGVLPDETAALALDQALTVNFNQPMDAQRMEQAFSLNPDGQEKLTGTSAWSDDFTTLTFTPTVQLERDTRYTIRIEADALTAAGTPLGAAYETSRSSVGDLYLVGSTPAANGLKPTYQSVRLEFSAPLPDRDLEQYFRFEPAVENYYLYQESETVVQLNGDFQANRAYNLVIDPALKDRYGGPLMNPGDLPFRTAPLAPRLEASFSQTVMFLTPQDRAVSVQLTNLYNVPLSIDTLSQNDFLSLIGPGSYDIRRSFRTPQREEWTETFEIASDKVTPVKLPLNPRGTGLEPGFYLLQINLNPDFTYVDDFLLVVSNVHLTYKISATDALVWAVDTRSGLPVANLPISLYAEDGSLLGNGFTDSDGVYRAELPYQLPPYESSQAVAGQPGEELFAAAVTGWDAGVEPYNYSISTDWRGPGLRTYLYTDRPIYRPGQTVYYRAIVRQQSNGRYTLPDEMSTVPVSLYDGEGTLLYSQELPLSVFGSAHDRYGLVEDAQPGLYRLESGEDSIYFQVAEYRKPEINLQVTFNQAEILAGENLSGQVNARYFFDAPAGNVPLTWALYESRDYFQVNAYASGPQDERWLDPYGYIDFPWDLGEPIAQGEGRTNPQGLLTLELPNPVESERLGIGTRRYTLEVTATDESGLPVSARSTLTVHPADFYIGIRPDIWAGQAGQEIGYDIQVVDWQNNPAGVRALQAEFSQVEYIRTDPPPERPYEFPTLTPQYTLIASVNFASGDDGKARLAFTAPKPGTYLLKVSGDGAESELMLWFGGEGQAVWPNLPNQRLRLTRDRDQYQPGDSAQIFIPNPFPQSAAALISIERGTVLRHLVQRLPPGGIAVVLPLTSEDAPNVYVSVSLLGQDDAGLLDFRQGFIRLDVEPIEQTLNVSLTRQPERTGPGEEVTLSLRVTDQTGQPVQGEFSLAVVDLAALALADPNSQNILDAFYGIQPLGVRTNLALAAYANRIANFAGGLGGGGGGDMGAGVVREDFPDTAYWSATLVTDANGEASLTLPLPDSLTTWQIDLRGVTVDTLVGQTQAQIVTSKDVLVRPVTPRFLVAGDHAQLAAIVQNNTPNPLEAQVSLQAVGFGLDEGQLAAQQVTLPANGRVRVEWLGTAGDVGEVELVFAVQAGEYQDAARPAQGNLPVLRYTARQAFATAGYLDQAGEKIELVSLPRAALSGGASELQVELSPSLTAALLNALPVLEHFEYECTEQTLARFLPNLQVYQMLQAFDISAPEVEARLERTLQPGLLKLLARQNDDGGWGWWSGEASSPYITAYALFGLVQAQQAGSSIPPEALQRSIDYLNSVRLNPAEVSAPYELDRLAMVHFALAQADAPDASGALGLFALRDQLSPWAKALLALALEQAVPGNPEAKTLLSELGTAAQRSATGAFWSDDSPRWQNLNSPVSTTGMVVYAIAQRDPASALLPDALRFLMSNRKAGGAWGSTFDSTWVLLAAAQYIQGTGELGADFTYAVNLNGQPLASGQAGGAGLLTPVSAGVPASSLYPNNPNALSIERSAGSGRLYYTALLDVSFPAEQVEPLNRGLSLTRQYFLRSACTSGECEPIATAPVGSPLTVRLALTVPRDAYYVVVEDFIPAGSEILDTSLKTSQLGDPFIDEGEPEPLYDVRNPFGRGWGWWFFQQPLIFDDHIAWAASYLPAGTYELTYTLTALQSGEFRVLPGRAYQFYFPEVQGSTAGEIFTVTP
jgi:hypothetical protein